MLQYVTNNRFSKKLSNFFIIALCVGLFIGLLPLMGELVGAAEPNSVPGDAIHIQLLHNL